MSDYYDDEDSIERSTKVMIKNFYYQRMREQLDYARDIAARLESECAACPNTEHHRGIGNE